MTGRINGLDAIRFVLAIWVVVGHVDLFQARFDKSTRLGLISAGVFNNAFSGPAAVIAFFVISGFCVHYPYRSDGRLRLIPYFARRYVRILIPMAAAMAVAWPLGLHFVNLNDSILWSLVAEEIYYTMYPALLLLWRRVGLNIVLGIAYLGAAGVILSDPGAGDYPSFGASLNWLLGLPCWLLGCTLAQQLESKTVAQHGASVRIWRWRAAAWLLSSVCSFLRFHSPLKYPLTLDLFAIFVFFWLRSEIAYYNGGERRPVALLERAGIGSYSVYLMHLHAAAVVALIPFSFIHSRGWWPLRLTCILVVCYGFYRLVEKPAHALARTISGKLAGVDRGSARVPSQPSRSAT